MCPARATMTLAAAEGPAVAAPEGRRMTSHRTVDLAVLAVAVVWGSSYLAAKEVASSDGVFALLAIRFAIATIGLGLLLAPRLRRITRAEIAYGVLFGGVLSVVFALETYGVTMTSASNAGLIIALTIIMTPLLRQWTRQAHVPPAFYGAAVLAVAGVGLLTQSGGLATPRPGDLLILLAAAARAVHVTVVGRFSEHRVLDSARITLVQLATCLAVFVALSEATGGHIGEFTATMTIRSWALTVYLALVCTVFAFFIQIWAVRQTSPERVSLLLGTEPLWAATLGVLLAHDPLTVIGLCGAVLILLGTNWGRVADTRGRAVGDQRLSSDCRTSLRQHGGRFARYRRAVGGRRVVSPPRGPRGSRPGDDDDKTRRTHAVRPTSRCECPCLQRDSGLRPAGP